MSRPVVAVVGAGNVGCALAAHLSLLGSEVRLVTRSDARLAPIRAAGGITLTGAVEGSAEIAMLTTSVADAVQGAQVVAVTVPSPALPFYAPALAESTDDSQLLWLDPGTGGALFLAADISRRTGRRSMRICQLSTTTHVSRMADPTTVRVLQLTSPALASFPGTAVKDCVDEVHSLLPSSFSSAATVLELDLANINALAHPAQMICNAGWIEATGGDFTVYDEGTGPGVARVIDAVDDERIAVADALAIPTRPFGQLWAEAGFIPAAAGRGRAYEALRAAEMIHSVKAPPALDHRYLHEDVGWGLVPWIHLAVAAGVLTPTMNALTALAGTLNGVDYLATGLTLSRMGLDAVPPERIGEYALSGRY